MQMDRDASHGKHVSLMQGARTGLLFLAPCLLYVVMSSRALFDPSVGYPDADRILMDGVFLRDFLHDLPFDAPLDYALLYYAQYPALSLGYRPPFLPAVEAIFITVFGLEIWVARLSIIGFGIIGLGAYFALLRRLYDSVTAAFGCALLGSLPFVVSLSWYTMAEIPVLAMILVTAFVFHCYVETRRPALGYAAAVSFALAIWTKQTAVFAVIWLLPYMMVRWGPRQTLASGTNWKAAVLFLVMASPIAAMAFTFGDLNVAQSIGENPFEGHVAQAGWENFLVYLDRLVEQQVTIPIIALSCLGATMAFQRQVANFMFLVLWIVATYVFFTSLNTAVARYTIFWIPAFCALAVAPLFYASRPVIRVGLAIALTGIVAANVYACYQLTPRSIRGFDQTARFVVANNLGPIVFVDAYNNGYFTFFLRKYDSKRRFYVLRGDKLLSSSAVLSDTWLDIKAETEDEVLNILNRHSIRYIVSESRDYTGGLKPHEALRRLLQTNAFRQLSSIPIESSLVRYRGQTLDVWEYLNASTAESDDLILDLPIIGRRIIIPSDRKSPRMQRYDSGS